MTRTFTRLLTIFCALAIALGTAACMGDEQATTAAQAQATETMEASTAAQAPTTAQIPQATRAELEAAGLNELPLAPAGDRVDLNLPSFSNPTQITNPLFPISDLHSALLNGTVDDKRFKVETTLLPETRIVEWPEGRFVKTRVSQYVAYLDGRIEEVALDLYAQADDGSVWYFGEDVFNYKEGLIGDREGTWIAGDDGPAAMIMPADPQLGDVYRPENVPGFVFEEVTVKSVDETVRGPTGPVEGAIIAEELHQDGAREDKTFAPGYGEFFTGAGGDVEALALAVPEDALRAQPPAELEALLRAANDVFAQADRNVGPVAKRSARAVARAWEALQAEEIPVRLRPVTAAAVKALGRAVESRDSHRTQQASLDVAQSGIDLELRYRPPSEIDLERFEVWARQLVLDASVKDGSAVAGDLATLEWIRDRFAHTLDNVERIDIDTSLAELRTLVNDDDLQGAAREAERLSALIAGP